MFAVFSRLANRHFILLCAASYIILSYSLFLTWPVRWPDEAQFAAVSRTFAAQGYLGTNMIAGMEGHMYWQPPLYFIVSALVIKLAGFHLEVLRTFSIIIGVGILFATASLTRRLSDDPRVLRFSVLLLALNPLFVNYAKLARMDGLCVLFILLGVISIQGDGQSKWFAGFFLALACVTHFMGGVAVFIIVMYTLVYGEEGKRWEFILPLVVPVLVVLGIWTLYIIQDTESFLVQMKFQLERKSFAPGESILQFVKSFWSVPLWFLTMVLSIALGAKGPSRRSRLIPSVLLVANLFFVGFAYEFSYQLYVVPFAAISIALFLAKWWRSEKPALRLSSLLVSALIIVNFLAYFGYFNYVNHYRSESATDYQVIVGQVEQRLTPGSKVMLSGYPSLFWGLKESSKGLRFVEPVVLSPATRDALFDDVRYIVFTRAHDPTKDSQEFLDRLVAFSQLFRQGGMELKPVAAFGSKREYAYSTEVFEVVPAMPEKPQ